MKERIFGTECEYALICRPIPGTRIASPDEEIFRDQIKSLNASLLSCLEEEDRPMAGEYLENGGRFYIDRGGHPEYATPECRGVRDLVVHEKAGDELIQGLILKLRAHWREKKGSPDIHVYKNNVDHFGNSYGSHENYLITPQAMENIDLLVPFLVTRQIFTGAGFITPRRLTGQSEFLLAQRSIFIDKVYSDRTSGVRGLINTRQRELYHRDQNRRLHVILGDSNMSETAIWLKIGTTALVLRLLEQGALDRMPVLDSPVEALKKISRSPAEPLEMEEGQDRYRALDIQRMYLEKAQSCFKPGDLTREESKILADWADVLNSLAKLKMSSRHMKLEDDPGELKKKIDWVTKLWLIGRSVQAGQNNLDRTRSKIIELKYHDLDPETGLFYRCQDLGLVDRLVEDREIYQARTSPPSNTRAALRGMIIKKTKNENVQVVVENWEKIQLRAMKKRPGVEHAFARHTRIMNSLAIVLDDPFQSSSETLDADLERFIKIWK